jgi:hypothetical protein
VLVVASVVFGLSALPSNVAPLTPDDAASHVGQNATVCGIVALRNFDADTQFWPRPPPATGRRRALGSARRPGPAAVPEKPA